MPRLAIKTACIAAVVTGAAGLLFTLFLSVPATFPVVTALFAGAAVYVIVKQHVVLKLRRLDAVLEDLRKRGGRSDEMADRRGDELEMLIRKADQTEFALRKRMIELSRAENYRREYVGDVSHEIKTPIFAIQGFAETLLNGALGDPDVNRGFVEKILHHANRLNALSRDLAEISRLETGALKLAPGRFHIAIVYEEVRESLELAARRKDIELGLDVSPGAEIVVGDRERIRQVLTNLVDNAVKYTNPGGWVRLVGRRVDDRVRLIVRDNGIGIAPEDVPRVTERFYRADKSRSRSQGGTGLGLSIVKHILAAHGTSLEIQSSPGAGSSFSFSLPTVTEPESVEV